MDGLYRFRLLPFESSDIEIDNKQEAKISIFSADKSLTLSIAITIH